MKASKGKPRPRILIADDEATIVETLQMILDTRGYEVWSTDNGREALEMVRKEAPDLILLDLVLQQMDGLAVLQEIREDEEVRDIPVIIMTVVTKDSDLADGFWQTATGADGFFTKPFDPFKLADKVDELLSERGSRTSLN